MVPLDDVAEGRSLTKRLVAYIESQALLRPFVAIAREVGIAESTVRHLFGAYVKRLENEASFTVPSFLCLEPITLLSYPRYLVCNVRTRTVVDLLPKEDPATVSAYFSGMRDRGAEIKHVLINMNESVRATIRQAIPAADVIVGSRHLTEVAQDRFRRCPSRMGDKLLPFEKRPLTCPTGAIAGWSEEFLRGFEHPCIQEFEREVSALLEVLPRIDRRHSFDAVRAKILAQKDLRTEDGIPITALTQAVTVKNDPSRTRGTLLSSLSCRGT